MRLSGEGSHQSKRGKREKHCVLKSGEQRIRQKEYQIRGMMINFSWIALENRSGEKNRAAGMASNHAKIQADKKTQIFLNCMQVNIISIDLSMDRQIDRSVSAIVQPTAELLLSCKLNQSWPMQEAIIFITMSRINQKYCSSIHY